MALNGGDMTAAIKMMPNPDANIPLAITYWPMRGNDGEKVERNTDTRMGQTSPKRMNHKTSTDFPPTK